LTKFKLDDIDMLLLRELQQDSSRPIHILSELASISLASCARRLKRMEISGHIDRYVALLNPAAMGLDLDVFISIRLTTQTLKAMEEFRKIVSSMPEVVECYALTGDSDFLLHVRTSGVKEYNVWLQKKLIVLSSIGTTHSSISLERVKYSTMLPLESNQIGIASFRKSGRKKNKHTRGRA